MPYTIEEFATRDSHSTKTFCFKIFVSFFVGSAGLLDCNLSWW